MHILRLGPPDISIFTGTREECELTMQAMLTVAKNPVITPHGFKCDNDKEYMIADNAPVLMKWEKTPVGYK
jgi:hypothetical protein